MKLMVAVTSNSAAMVRTSAFVYCMRKGGHRGVSVMRSTAGEVGKALV